CEVAYGDKLLTTAPGLSSAVDDYARANGVTDDLLDRLAPMAKGDTIMILTIAGRPPQPIGDKGAQVSSPAPSQPMMRGRRGLAGGMPSGSSETLPRTDNNVFEMSASLFSIRLHRSVAM